MKSFNRLQAIKNILIIQKYLGIGTNRANKFYNELISEDMLDTNDIDSFVAKSKLPSVLKAKLKNIDYAAVENIIKTAENSKIDILTIFDNEYPERLKNINTPPLLLFIKGEFPSIDELPIINIVGPRKASDFGKKCAYSLGLRLSKAGFIVVSGGAVGCDYHAHKGALDAGGKSIAVLGCGILTNYLPQNSVIRQRISENGCLISEYPPKEPASKFTFPIRNRIMSALSLGTIVVEAGYKSGALNTATHAVEQGRDVFVIPGNPTYEHYKGSNNLLRDGAKPLLEVSDVFNEYTHLFPDKIDIEKAYEKIVIDVKIKKNKKKSTFSLSNEAKIVYNYLDKQNFTVDDVSGCGISSDEILCAITELEMEQIIEAQPGGTYKLL